MHRDDNTHQYNTPNIFDDYFSLRTVVVFIRSPLKCVDQQQKFESRNEMARRYYIARVKCVGSNCRGNYAASLRRRPLSM